MPASGHGQTSLLMEAPAEDHEKLRAHPKIGIGTGRVGTLDDQDGPVRVVHCVYGQSARQACQQQDTFSRCMLDWTRPPAAVVGGHLLQRQDVPPLWIWWHVTQPAVCGHKLRDQQRTGRGMLRTLLSSMSMVSTRGTMQKE